MGSMKEGEIKNIHVRMYNSAQLRAQANCHLCYVVKMATYLKIMARKQLELF